MKNSKLEFLRGIASLEVFINHVCANSSYLKTKTWTAFFANWATEAVVLFFLLSGIVIHISQDKKKLRPWGFFKNRIRRIYPSLILGMFLAGIALKVVYNENISWIQFVGNFFMLGTLQGYIVQSIKTNPVIWSLSFEMFFYLIFTFCISKVQQKRLLLWLFTAIVLIPFYYQNYNGIIGHLIAMFAFSAIWLTGFFLYKFKKELTIPDFNSMLFFSSLLPLISRLHFSDNYYDVSKYILFGFFTIPLFLFCLGGGEKLNDNNENRWNNYYLKCIILFFCIIILFINSRSLLKNKIIYVALPILVLTYSYLKFNYPLPYFFKQFTRIGSFLGKISYSLYIIHFPIILLVNYYLGKSHYILTILFVILFSFFIAWYMENNIYAFINKSGKRKSIH